MVKTLISCIKDENSIFSPGLKEFSSVVEHSSYIRAVRGSNPLILKEILAQLVEHMTFNLYVAGSSPVDLIPLPSIGVNKKGVVIL